MVWGYPSRLRRPLNVLDIDLLMQQSLQYAVGMQAFDVIAASGGY
ncbi:hypothetical protein S7335_940 [Synechococcus sp. PCC 7335]|nr:hypothetical protein S7335_940 [Synechococcus sp. PCC 7335]